MITVGVVYSHCIRDPKEGEKYFREALAAWQDTDKESPNEPEVLVSQAHALHWLGAVFMDTGRNREAEEQFRKVLAIREKMPAERRDMVIDVYTKAYLARVLLQAERPREAEVLLREVIPMREKVVDDFPSNYEHRRRLSAEHLLLSECLLKIGRTDEGERALRRCVTISQKLVADFPDALQGSGSVELSWAYYSLGLLLQDTARPEEAAEAFRQGRRSFSSTARRSFPARFASPRPGLVPGRLPGDPVSRPRASRRTSQEGSPARPPVGSVLVHVRYGPVPRRPMEGRGHIGPEVDATGLGKR